MKLSLFYKVLYVKDRRPPSLGIVALEDTIVQHAVLRVLIRLTKRTFWSSPPMGCDPGRKQDALKCTPGRNQEGSSASNFRS